MESNDENKNLNTNNAKLKTILMWIISIFCIISGIAFIKDIIAPSILILLSGFILLPPLDELIKSKLSESDKIKMFSALRTIFVIVAIIIVSINIPDNSDSIQSLTSSKINQNTINNTIVDISNFKNGKYDGSFVNGKMQGQGTFEWNDGTKYVGEFQDNKINGNGILTTPENESYEGNFINGKKNGQGTYKFANGDIYEGNWLDDKMSGQGTYTFSNGEKYVGEFKNNKFNGQGTYSKDGKEYTGTWKNNQYTK